MKKTILISFLSACLFSFGQVPQRFNKVIVTGDIISPKFIKTGSTVDSVLLGNGSARSINSIKTDTVSLSNRINSKEPANSNIQSHIVSTSNPHSVTKAQVGLGSADDTSDPNKPISIATQAALNTKQDALISGTSIRTVNGNSVLGSGDIQIVSGGGGAPTNIYLSNVSSSISGYKNASPTIDPTETLKTITATSANTITWGEKYLYIAPVATTIIPSGFWELHAYGSVSTATGMSNLVFRIIRYSGTTETFLGTITSFEVNNTSDGEIFANGSLNDITVSAGDYLGIQVGFLSDGTSPSRTLTYTIGNGHATHFNTPLPIRHSSLRDKNGEVDFQHLTAAQVSIVNNTSGTNTGDETLTSIKTKLGAASSNSSGYLTNTDWNTFNGKQPAGSYLTSEVDGSTTNEIQTPTLTGNTLGLSLTGTTVDISQATAVQANTAKVSNANHTGDATGSTTLTLATVNSNIGTYNNVTINAKGLATAGSNISYEPSFSKNTAFNKNFGTTTGTVLEGRTFGTAANSSVGDFQPTENQRLSTTNSPSFNTITSTVENGTSPLTVNSTTLVSNLNAHYLGSALPDNSNITSLYSSARLNYNLLSSSAVGVFPAIDNANAILSISRLPYGDYNTQMGFNSNNDSYIRTTVDGSDSGWKKIYHSGNLTNSLSSNSISRWNGTSFSNSLLSDNGTDLSFDGGSAGRVFIGRGVGSVGRGLSITTDGGGDAGQLLLGQYRDKSYWALGRENISAGNFVLISAALDGIEHLRMDMNQNNGNARFYSTTTSTSTATGALVVDGGIGSDHVRANNFYGALIGNASTATNVSYSGLTGTVPTWNQNTTGSAETLTNSRTIWGQSFNGSGNVSGAISGATSGDFSGDVTVTATTQSDMDGVTINSGSIKTNGGISVVKDINAGGNINAYGDLTSYGSIIKAGGTSSQYLMADGSVSSGGSTGDSYTCTATGITGVTSPSVIAYSSKNGSLTKVMIGGTCSTNVLGACTIRLSIPTIGAWNMVCVTNVIGATGTYRILPSFVANGATSYIDLTFYTTTSTDVIQFTVVGEGK